MALEVSIQNLADAINNLAGGVHRSNSNAKANDVLKGAPIGVRGSTAEQCLASSSADGSKVAPEDQAVTSAREAELRVELEGLINVLEKHATERESKPESKPKAKPEPKPEPKALEGDFIPADTKPWGAGNVKFDAAFNTTTGTITLPFLKLAREAKLAILAQFGLKRLSECPEAETDKMAQAIKNASA